MKNIIRMIATLVATALVILLMVKGLSIGSIKVYSISEIIEENSKLDNEINDLNKLKNEDYKKSLDSLSSSTKSLETSKQSYLDEASISTDSEIKEATISQNYSMEYLWKKVGSYATEEGVNLKWEVQSSGSGKYTYKFIVYNKTTNKWGLISNFSATNAITWKASSAGNRVFYVDVKDSKGNVVRSTPMNLKTTK